MCTIMQVDVQYSMSNFLFSLRTIRVPSWSRADTVFTEVLILYFFPHSTVILFLIYLEIVFWMW